MLLFSDNSENSSKCNSNGEYDGEYGIDHWPSNGVNVVCPQGIGSVVWKCQSNGHFDSNGPNWNDCYHWFFDFETFLKKKNLDNSLKVTEIIANNTKVFNSLIHSVKMNKILETMQELEIFMNNEVDLSFEDSKHYASNCIQILSNLIDQKYAWINSTVEQKTEMASKILQNIQYSSFTMVLKQNNTKHSDNMTSGNIYINSFVIDSSEEILFPKEFDEKKSSIIIPKGIESLNQNKSLQIRAIGALIDKIHDYLLGGINENKKINSAILAFSLNNRTESVKLNKEVIIRL